MITPIHPSSTFVQDGVGGVRAGGYEYSRSANPTRTALQECLAALEGGRHGIAFGSGMGATDVLLRVLLKPGDHVVIPHDAYGGTFRIVDKVLARWGVQYTPVDLGDLDALRAAVRPDTKLLWCETPTNPLLGIADIAAAADVARTAGARLVVDNTFASPYLQTPLALGADVVLHSTTKYVGGHSDVVGGALVTSDDELAEELRVHPERHRLGARPVRRLADPARGEDPGRADGAAQRQRRAHRRAARPATRASSGCSTRACPTHPGHEVAAKQMRRFGGMVSFTAAGGREAALRICAATRGLHPGRVAGRGRVADRAPGGDDAPVGGRVGAGGAGQPGPALGRHRGRRGPGRRPARGPGARRLSRGARGQLLAGVPASSGGTGCGAGSGTTRSPGAMQPPTSS